MTLIADTDFLIAQLISEDTNHQRAMHSHTRIAEGDFGDVKLLLLSATLGEFATIAIIKVGLQRAKDATKNYAQMYSLVDLTPDMVDASVELFQKQTSKENSLFDCYVMTAATAFNADYILSFDKGYPQNGYTLLSQEKGVVE